MRFLYNGWPGSAHDQRVVDSSTLLRSDSGFFTKNQYLLGDSAYAAHERIVPAFKKPSGGEMTTDQAIFNTLLAKARITVEHTIGIQKARFPLLKSMRFLLGSEE